MKGRPKGALNKPKFQLVELKQLNEFYKENMKIPVHADFLKGFFIPNIQTSEIQEETKISIREIQENE